MVRRARDYARGHGIGAKACVNTRLFPCVTWAVLNNALQDKIKAVLGTRYATDVLTTEEELKLEEWIVSSARGKDPATNSEISDKIVVMLKARKADCKHRKHGPGTIALTLREHRLATQRGAHVSLTYLAGFAARHPRVRPMKERNADVTRTKKQNEGVVDKHFYSEYGVQASLEAHGHLDMESKMIRVRHPQRAAFPRCERTFTACDLRAWAAPMGSLAAPCMPLGCVWCILVICDCLHSMTVTIINIR